MPDCSRAFLSTAIVGTACGTELGQPVKYAGYHTATSPDRYLVIAQAAPPKYSWGCLGSTINASSFDDGVYNTNIIVGATCPSYPDKAAAYCASLGSGWYLPAMYIFNFTLYPNRATLALPIDTSYWTSTEYTSDKAVYVTMDNEYTGQGNKQLTYYTLCIRHY